MQRVRTFLGRAWRWLWPVLRDVLLMTLGATIVAAATRIFLIPNQVVTGGVTGIAIISNTFLGVPIGLVVAAVNVPLLLVSMRALGGWRFALRTLYTTACLAVVLEYSGQWLTAVTDDPLLYSLYGGLLTGLGSGLIFRAQSTAGGFDIIARLLERSFGYAPGRSSLILNGVVFLVAILLYGPEKILYAILVSFISSRALDLVLSFGGGMNQIFIITADPERVTQDVMVTLKRGVTIVPATGGYTGASHAMLMCVMTRSEVPMLTAMVARIDPKAFVVVGEAVDVYGSGFSALTRPHHDAPAS